MKLEKKRYDEVVILRFVGEFDTFNLPMFTERVERMVDAGEVWFVLDVRLLTFINSSALGYLIKMSKRVRKAKGEVVLAQPSKFVRKTLSTLGLDQAFPMYESVADAILHFKKGADVGKLDLEKAEYDEALHGAVPVLFRKQVVGGDFPPNQVGRIVNLYADGLLFRYEPAGGDDPVEGDLQTGTKLKLKFRQPFLLKDHYFEIDADIREVSSIEDVDEGGARMLNVRVTYDKVKEEDRVHLDQFVRDQEIWRSEVRG